jgi:pimeloyl-ACP methyl ester carboxylesterase
VNFIVLQAPVSDREHLMTLPKTEEHVAIARGMKATGLASEFLPRAAMWAPITAARFLDLATKEGLDDLFSSDLSDSELAERLGHVAVPTLFVMSMADEYVPPSVDVHRLCERFQASITRAVARVEKLEGANHALYGHEEAFVDVVERFMSTLP